MENIEIKPIPLTKEELEERQYRQKKRELKISRARALVLKGQIATAYQILEDIRFDFLSDTMFRDYFVKAKRELESAISDFLLSDTYWEKRILEHSALTPREYAETIITSAQGKPSN